MPRIFDMLPWRATLLTVNDELSRLDRLVARLPRWPEWRASCRKQGLSQPKATLVVQRWLLPSIVSAVYVARLPHCWLEHSQSVARVSREIVTNGAHLMGFGVSIIMTQTITPGTITIVWLCAWKKDWTLGMEADHPTLLSWSMLGCDVLIAWNGRSHGQKWLPVES